MTRLRDRVRRTQALGKLPLLVLLAALPALCPPVASAAETPKKVLLFCGTDPNLPSVILVSQILRAALEKGVRGRVQFYSEALDTHRIPEEKYEQEIIKYLQRKYEDEKLDLVQEGRKSSSRQNDADGQSR